MYEQKSICMIHSFQENLCLVANESVTVLRSPGPEDLVLLYVFIASIIQEVEDISSSVHEFE